MFFIFAQCGGNANAAAVRYRELHPGKHAPRAAVFRRLAARLYSSGSFQPDRTGTGRSCRIPTARLDAVFAEFDRDGTQSVREIGRRLGVSRTTVHRQLQDQGMRPYKYVRVQTLHPRDYVQRMKYSRWLLGEIERNPSFCRYVLWTDEALFTRGGCFNAHNSHVWGDENPIAIRPHAIQGHWSVNLWAGICDDFVVGPYILPDRLNGPTYIHFLEHVLPGLLEEIPLEIRRNMYFQHDGASAHYAANVRTYLDEAFRDRWIGRGGSVPWPPRSPDMNPLDFFFWGHLKTAVYRDPMATRDEVVARIHGAVATISRDTLRRVQYNIRRRAEACIEVRGGHIEPILATLA
ncbi:hypothetical protein WH47_05048 [Habropoda laboriosa]|uniref:Transposable element Tc3 transposase n=1 Tax=Habropoda laboriosa TaxID=597456 RepID=A0A0L7RKL3_9HYME|nr:hypothetical protein WH47_05048 [Habropoda laboriosa]